MNINELAMEYGHAAALLRGRIKQLELERKEAGDDESRLQLDGRLRPLRAMYRETRSVERHLERYYARFEKKQGGTASE